MKIIKPLLLGVITGTAAFSTTYIIAGETVTKEDHKYNTINDSFQELSSAFDYHVADHLDTDDIDEVYSAIGKNFETLSNSIENSKSELVQYFKSELNDSIEEMSKVLTDKTETLDEKIVNASEDIESLSGEFIDVQESQKEIVAELSGFILEYDKTQQQITEDIALLETEMDSMKDASTITQQNIEKIQIDIDKIESDLSQIDVLRQSIQSVDNKIEHTIDYLEEIAGMTDQNSFDIDALETSANELKTSVARLEDRIDILDLTTAENSSNISILNNQFQSLEVALKTDVTNIEVKITDMKTTIDNLKTTHENDKNILNEKIDDLKNIHEADKTLMEQSIEDLKLKYDAIFASNEKLKEDVTQLHTSTNSIYEGLLELERGFIELQGKVDSAPTITTLYPNQEITRDRLPTIYIPNVENIKAISIFLKVSNFDGSEIVNANIINAFYDNQGTFTGTISTPDGYSYLAALKMNSQSISVSGFWFGRPRGPWESLRRYEQNTYNISKIIVTY